MSPLTPCVLWFCVYIATQVPLSTDADSEVQQAGTLHGLAGSDFQFFKAYLDFLNSRNHKIYIPIAIVCVILGLAGNACFLFFFGNPTSDDYMTRDALYLRRLAAADMLICGMVIPYSVLFEAKLIDNRILCKTLEYVRHVLVYSSHLLLVCYSMELNEGDNFMLAKDRLDEYTLKVIGFAIVVSVPVLFIFDVGVAAKFNFLMNITDYQEEVTTNFSMASTIDNTTVGPAEQSNRYSYLSPNFCHLLLNYDGTADYFEEINVFKGIYFMSFGFMMFISTIMIVYQSMQYVDDNPLVGRESAFVRFIEADHPDVSSKLRRLSVEKQQRTRRSSVSQALKLTAKRSQGTVRSNFGNTENPGRTTDKAGNIDTKGETTDKAGSIDTKGETTDKAGNIDTKGETIDKASSIDTSGETAVDLQPRMSTSVDVKIFEALTRKSTVSPNLSLDQNKQTPSRKNKAKTPKSNSEYELLVQQGGRRSRRTSFSSEKNVPLVKFLCLCDCVRSNEKRVRRAGGSYKLSLACLIVVDILVAALTIVFYQITDQTSVSLNLIHLKSVFSFYVISLFHADLRRATWGFHGRRCCPRRQQAA